MTTADEPGNALLSVQDVADEVQVHYMTAYRWVRRGDLRATKAGGRLRIRRADLEEFLAQREVDVAVDGGDGGRTDWDRHLRTFLQALLSGDELAAERQVRSIIADGATAGAVHTRLITPALHRVGDLWADGDITVAEEHRASNICATIVAQHTALFRRRGPRRGIAVTLTLPGDDHGLAPAMVADFLRAAGYEVHHLGTSVPIDELRRFLRTIACDVVCCSVTLPAPEALYVDLVRAAASREPPVAVVFGGQAVDRARAEAAGGQVVGDLDELASRLPPSS